MRLLLVLTIFTIMNVLFLTGTACFIDFVTKIQAESVNPENVQEQVNIDIKLFQYKPGDLEVQIGSTVTWTNNDAIEHSVTHGTPEEIGNEFDSDFFTKDQSYSKKFDKEGKYPYYCKRHPSMKGNIKVVSK